MYVKEDMYMKNTKMHITLHKSTSPFDNYKYKGRVQQIKLKFYKGTCVFS